MWRRGVPAAMALVLATLAAASGPRPVEARAPVAAAEDRLAGIRALLDRRAEAMLAGDRAAFLATVARDDRAFVRRQRRLFDGFRILGLASYELRATDRWWPELTTPRERSRYGSAADPTVLHVEERYGIRDWDRSPALEDLYLTFVRRDGEWRIVSDTDLDDVALYSGRKLWELGRIVTRESEHFLFVSHPDLADEGSEVLRAAERALGRVDEAWPLSWPKRAVIVAPSDSEELRRMLQATFDLDVFVAFVASAVERTRDYRLVGHRVLLHWPVFSRQDDRTREDTLTHELLHLATRERAGPHTAAWVEEGVAQWVSGDDPSGRVAARIEGGRFEGLPRNHEFFTGEASDIVAAYQRSASAARFTVERWGADALADLYRRLGAVRLAPGTSRYHVGRAMEATLGIGLEEFERRWATWLERTR